MDKPTLVYVTYIATTLEQVWSAITGEAFTQQYWGDGQLQSDWQVDSSVQQIDQNGEVIGIVGKVLEAHPPYLLCYTFESRNITEAMPSRVRFELQQYGERVKLTLIHERLDTQSCMVMSRRWSAHLSYLKRRLEIEDILALVA